MNLTMSNISTSKMTSKGQVVIPEEIRKYLRLESGVKFIVMAGGDSIIFKIIEPIAPEDVKNLLKASKQLAKQYAMKESEIATTIKAVRKNKRRKSNTAEPTDKSSDTNKHY